jgi:hypothetical protein
MSRIFKYVIISDAYPYVFSEASAHDQHFRDCHVTSAGMGSIGIGIDGKLKVSAYGESVSLGIKSANTDAETLRRIFVDPFFED